MIESVKIREYFTGLQNYILVTLEHIYWPSYQSRKLCYNIANDYVNFGHFEWAKLFQLACEDTLSVLPYAKKSPQG